LRIGITERGDAGLDQSWIAKAKEYDGVIAITKAPHLLPELPGNVIVHCTITGLGGSKYEPGVAKPEVTLKAYERLVNKYGALRIVLRIDPIIPTTKGTDIAYSIWQHNVSRVRISFLDMYSHVVERGFPRLWEGLHAPLETRIKIWEHLNRPEVCGEPGMKCTGCVSELDMKVLGLTGVLSPGGRQRSACACAAEKTEMLSRRGQCAHGCIYCYWK